MAKILKTIKDIVVLCAVRAGIFGGSLEGICYLFAINDQCDACLKEHRASVIIVVGLFLLFSVIIWDAKRYALRGAAASHRKKR
jgi:hypothetical protein